MNTPKHPRHCRVQVRLCSQKCNQCQDGHELTDVLDAERIDAERVRITQRHPLWFGAVLGRREYVFWEASE